MGRYYVYILECSDKTLYTGWTNNVEKRIREHNNGKWGARYTRTRRPVKLVRVETCSTLSDALRRELQIKGLSREQKLRLTGKGVGKSRRRNGAGPEIRASQEKRGFGRPGEQGCAGGPELRQILAGQTARLPGAPSHGKHDCTSNKGRKLVFHISRPCV